MLNALRFGAKRKVKWWLNALKNGAKRMMKSIKIRCNGINTTLSNH